MIKLKANGKGKRHHLIQDAFAHSLPDAADASLSEQSYRVIRSLIEYGELRPGQAIREVELARRLGISRTPVREAIRRLISESVLTVVSSRKVILTELTENHILELYAVLEILEGTAAQFCALHASDEEKASLQKILEEEQKHPDDASKLSELNNMFHNTIYSSSHNRYLSRSLRWYADSINLLKGTTFNDPERRMTSHQQHKEILAAIKQRDHEWAYRAARYHIQESRKIRMQQLFG